jgi:hypothetical protein
MDEERSTVRKVTRALHDAMRGDLGLGPDEDPVIVGLARSRHISYRPTMSPRWRRRAAGDAL